MTLHEAAGTGPENPEPEPRPFWRRPVVWGAAAAALVLVLGGLAAYLVFGGGDDAGSGTPNSSTTAPLTEEESLLKYAQCMRDHGIPMEDPKPGGGISLNVPQGMDPSEVDAASQDCKKWMPGGGEQKPIDPEALEKTREYAKCMRENGLPDFPDPDANGGIALDGIGPGDPDFDNAQTACQHLMGPGSGTNTGKEG